MQNDAWKAVLTTAAKRRTGGWRTPPETRDNRARLMTALGLSLLLLDGAIHLWVAPDQFTEATYEGVIFLANAAGVLLACAAILRGFRLGWLFGALVAASGAAAYLVSRTAGLPTLPRDPAWHCPYGVVSVAAELLFAWVAVRVWRERRPQPRGAAAQES